MKLDLEKLMAVTKRAEAISKQLQIALMEFDVGIQAEDPEKQEEARVKIHQLTDDQLDLQLEIKLIKEAHTEVMMQRIKKQFK